MLQGRLPDLTVVLSAPPSFQQQLVESLGEHVRLHFTDSPVECTETLRRHHRASVLIGVPPTLRHPNVAAFGDLREAFPHTAFVALYCEGLSNLSALTMLSARGTMHVISSEQLDRRAECLATLSASEVWSMATRVWSLASIYVTAPESMVSLMIPALRLSHGPVKLPQLAGVCRMHERTLRKYCHRNQLPSPQWIIGWARMLLAAYYLEELGRTVQSVADLLGFGSPSLFANHIRRYTGMTPTALRERGALELSAGALARFVESKAERRARAK